MAINKKLIFWDNPTFNPPISSTDTTKDVLWTSIVFFSDTFGVNKNKIWTHGVYYDGALALPLSGGTMSNKDLVANLNADLLDGYESEELIVSNLLSPPSTPKVGQEWMDLTSGIKYTYIYDGNSYQWVELGTSGISTGGGQVAILDERISTAETNSIAYAIALG